jgi:hypothetical protein
MKTMGPLTVAQTQFPCFILKTTQSMITLLLMGTNGCWDNIIPTLKVAPNNIHLLTWKFAELMNITSTLFAHFNIKGFQSSFQIMRIKHQVKSQACYKANIFTCCPNIRNIWHKKLKYISKLRLKRERARGGGGRERDENLQFWHHQLWVKLWNENKDSTTQCLLVSGVTMVMFKDHIAKSSIIYPFKAQWLQQVPLALILKNTAFWPYQVFT